jgi:hypothetical protein
MGKRNICPVCENLIPEDVVDFCFYCGFNLIKSIDKKQITKAKLIFVGENSELHFWPKQGTQKGPNPIFDFFIGFVTGVVFLIFILIARSPTGIMPARLAFSFCLAMGFLIGLIIYLIDRLIYDT